MLNYKNETKTFLSSAVVCLVSTALIYLLALRGKVAKRGSTGYLVFFAFFTFACMCDLWLGLAIDNINDLFSFYLNNNDFDMIINCNAFTKLPCQD